MHVHDYLVFRSRKEEKEEKTDEMWQLLYKQKALILDCLLC